MQSQVVQDGSPRTEQPPSHVTLSCADTPTRTGDINSQTHSPVDSGPNAPVIDPSLDVPSDQTIRTSSATQIMQANLRAPPESNASSRTSSSDGGDLNQGVTSLVTSKDGNAAGVNAGARVRHSEQQRDTLMDEDRPERPTPMEHVLTEDGEPMLNPGLLYLFPSGSDCSDLMSIQSRIVDSGSFIRLLNRG
jgi:hypothetical protein